MTDTAAPRLAVEEIRFYERPVTLRMPFRFGVVTMTAAPQAFARVRITLADGRGGWGAAAEMMVPKWFDKDPALSNDENFDQLRTALDIARASYLDAGAETAFGLAAACYPGQIAAGAARGLNSLTASYGPALIDRAVLDALCRVLDVPFAEALRNNLPGIEPGAVASDLADFDIEGFLATMASPSSIEARHTVGLTDRLTDEDVGGDGRVTMAGSTMAGSTMDCPKHWRKSPPPTATGSSRSRWAVTWWPISTGSAASPRCSTARAGITR